MALTLYRLDTLATKEKIVVCQLYIWKGPNSSKNDVKCNFQHLELSSSIHIHLYIDWDDKVEAILKGL